MYMGWWVHVGHSYGERWDFGTCLWDGVAVGWRGHGDMAMG